MNDLQEAIRLSNSELIEGSIRDMVRLSLRNNVNVTLNETTLWTDQVWFLIKQSATAFAMGFVWVGAVMLYGGESLAFSLQVAGTLGALYGLVGTFVASFLIGSKTVMDGEEINKVYAKISKISSIARKRDKMMKNIIRAGSAEEAKDLQERYASDFRRFYQQMSQLAQEGIDMANDPELAWGEKAFSGNDKEAVVDWLEKARVGMVSDVMSDQNELRKLANLSKQDPAPV